MPPPPLQELFGTAEHHVLVRQQAIQQIERNREAYLPFLGEDFASYVKVRGGGMASTPLHRAQQGGLPALPRGGLCLLRQGEKGA